MTKDAALVEIRSAGESLRRARLALSDPGPDSAALVELDVEGAIGAVRRFAESGSVDRLRTDQAICGAVRALRAECAVVSALISQVQAFHSNCLRNLELRMNGYTAEGEAKPFTVTGQHRMRG